MERGRFPQRKKACGGMLPIGAFREFDLDEKEIQTRMEKEVFVFPWFRRITSQNNVTVLRSSFDQSLALAAQMKGAQLITSCQAQTVVLREDRRVEVKAKIGDSHISHTGKVVIFADGVGTIANKAMGIGFKKNKKNQGFGLEYAFEAPNNQLREYSIFFGNKKLTGSWGYAWVFPNKDALNVGVCLLAEEFKAFSNKERILEDFIASESSELALMLRGRPIIKKIGGFIPLEVSVQLCDDSALCIGDAAGLVYPLTAGGISIALYSGRVAASTVDGALASNDYSRRALRSYEEEIKSSVHYQTMIKQALAVKLLARIGRFHHLSYPKLFHIWKLGSELNMFEKLRILLYPLLGGWDKRKTPISTPHDINSARKDER